MAKKVLIVLDPGHRPKYNKGVAPGYYEGDKMYTLSEYQKTALETFGFDVIITRKRENNMTLQDRGQVAVKNGKGYDHVVFLSNHTNACDTPSVRGTLIFRSLYLPESRKLSDKLCKVIAETIGTNNRGTLTKQCSYGDYYGVIRSAVNNAKSESAAKKGVVDFAYLIEYGFHTNTVECAFLNDDTNLEILANVTAKTIADYFGYEKKTSTPKPITKPTVDNFFPARGYFKKGDTSENVGKIASFMRKVFPSYTSEKALGNYYGDNLISAVKEFQKRTGLEPDGYFGPLTLAKLETFGFKK